MTTKTCTNFKVALFSFLPLCAVVSCLSTGSGSAGFGAPASSFGGVGANSNPPIDATTSASASAVTVPVPAAAGGVVPHPPPVRSTDKRLFLVRHGEVINPGGPGRAVYYGAMDVPLSPLGEMEAAAAASYLERFRLHRIASSPLSRAVFGAEEVRRRQEATHGWGGEGVATVNGDGANGAEKGSSGIFVHHGFRELDRGSWCGKTKEEIGPDLLARFDACDESVTPGDGGESYPFLKSRVLAARDELLGLTDCGEASALVSHLQVTRCILSDALNMPTSEMTGLPIATASVTCIDYCGEGRREPTVHFTSFKPDVGLRAAVDRAN